MGGPTTDVSVVTSGHDIADARLHRQVAALTAHGLSVEVLALGHGVDAPREAVRVRTWTRRPHLGRAALAVDVFSGRTGATPEERMALVNEALSDTEHHPPKQALRACRTGHTASKSLQTACKRLLASPTRIE